MLFLPFFVEGGGFGGYFLFIMTSGVHIDVSLVCIDIRHHTKSQAPLIESNKVLNTNSF